MRVLSKKTTKVCRIIVSIVEKLYILSRVLLVNLFAHLHCNKTDNYNNSKELRVTFQDNCGCVLY